MLTLTQVLLRQRKGREKRSKGAAGISNKVVKPMPKAKMRGVAKAGEEEQTIKKGKVGCGSEEVKGHVSRSTP